MIDHLKICIFLMIIFFSINTAFSQKKVALDNWYNAETHKNTGLPYHYLWTDTAWSGFSRWGKIFTDNGAEILQISRPTQTVLSGISVYIIVDPDTITENPSPNYIDEEDIKVIVDWVKQGGTLVIMANDGPNCEFTHLNNLSSRFGITFNHVSLHPVLNKNWEMGAFTNLPDHPLFSGVNKIYLKEISSLKLIQPAIAILNEDSIIYMAECKMGAGKVIAITDPWIYNEYIDHDRLPADFDNRKAAENFTKYLLNQL